MKITNARLLRSLATLGVAALLVTSAFAGPQQHKPRNKQPTTPPAPPSGAPEIDPSIAGSLAALLVGGALLLQSRRSPRKVEELA